jgi:hypothetical protein
MLMKVDPGSCQLNCRVVGGIKQWYSIFFFSSTDDYIMTELHATPSYKHIQPIPAPRHHLTIPSSAPLTNAPGPDALGFGLQETAQTSVGSWIVETALRAERSHTLIVLSADLFVFTTL